MTTEVLQKKTSRYLCGQSVPAEQRQIQTWLSCIADKIEVSGEERAMIENEITGQVQAYVASTLLLYPKPEAWWKKVTAFF